MRVGVAIVLALCALAAAGCGDGGGGAGAGGTAPLPPFAGDARAGRQTFDDAGCGGCHTLAAADAHGAFGPNLDHSTVTYAQAYDQVEHGGGGMPSFGDRLTAREIADVARFVVSDRTG